MAGRPNQRNIAGNKKTDDVEQVSASPNAATTKLETLCECSR